MKIEEMQEYLEKYNPEEDIVFLVVNTHEEKCYNHFNYFV